ncbi:MAG: pentapeptide repeat-containing protein, partial [Silvanigrellaceae bacterium]
MKDLHSILKAVSRGKMEVPRAEALIQELFEASVDHRTGDAGSGSSSRQRDKPHHREEGPKRKSKRAKSSIDNALASLGEKIGFDALLRKSRELGRKVEFKPAGEGFDCKLSIFSSVMVDSDTQAEANSISGSQWRDAAFREASEVRKNNFTLSQVSGLDCERSNFSSNEFGLARLSKVTIRESRFENNRLSRTQLTDVGISEADFTHNRLLRSNFSGVVLNASRLAHSVFTNCNLNECEIDQSDLQGLRFEDCNFTECRFSNCEIVDSNSRIMSGLRAHGVVFDGLKSVDELLLALEPTENKKENPPLSGLKTSAAGS